MKLNAKKIAVAIWVVAAMLAITQVFEDGYFYLMNGQVRIVRMDIGTILANMIPILISSGLLAALGAGVHLLGEIRDRLPERSN
jgi:hypothetical protein